MLIDYKRLFSLCKVLSMNIKNVSTVTIIGCGLMGSGIAQVSAASGFKVNLVDINQDLLTKSMSGIKESAQRVAKKKFSDDAAQIKPFVSDLMSNITASTNAKECAQVSDIVIEAIVENLEIKQKLFRELDAVAPVSCVFASNTSSLPIADIAKVTKRLDKFAGIHFFNPVPVMKLVEIIRLPQTSDDTYQRVSSFAQQLGKVTVSCKDTPGFIVNRLLVPYCVEAMRMLERGDASKEDIDVAMKLGAGYPMGPLELSDYVGLDTLKFVMDGWSKILPNMSNPDLLTELVNKGHCGKKSGQGFYKYDAKGNRIPS